jgi:hypothetical protein
MFIHHIFGIIIVVPVILYLISNCETCLETKHRLHAQEIAHSLDLRKYDGIICVSGDGVMVEVSKEPHFPYAYAILCNLLCSENSHVFRYLSTVDSICLLAIFFLSLKVILFCF